MKTEVPQWVIEYNNNNYQSSAGKAVKILMERNAKLEKALREILESGVLTWTQQEVYQELLPSPPKD